MSHDTQTPIIFLTARFRSGSTMLWNLYDRQPGYRAYYEPCHDNLVAHIRYTTPMESHRGVRSYWDAYLPLQDDVERLHRPEFGLARLHLEAGDDWPEFEAYLRMLADRARPAQPVFGFNRLDLRLPWLRARFPDARIVHLHRNARDVWASMVSHLPAEPSGGADATETPETPWPATRAADNPYEPHVYDLVEWSASLAETFPFLADPRIESLYERHYYLWKLSYLMGTRSSDVSLSYDDDFRRDPCAALRALADAGCFTPDGGVHEELAGSIQPGGTGEWLRHHPSEWFEAIERRAEALLDRLGLNELYGREPLASIRRARAPAWKECETCPVSPIIWAVLAGSSRHRGEVTRLLHIVRNLEERQREMNIAPEPDAPADERPA